MNGSLRVTVSDSKNVYFNVLIMLKTVNLDKTRLTGSHTTRISFIVELTSAILPNKINNLLKNSIISSYDKIKN